MKLLEKRLCGTLILDHQGQLGSRSILVGSPSHLNDQFLNHLYPLYNILNFGPNTYRHLPIDYDDYINVLFLYWVKDPTAYEHDDLFYILGV